MRLIQIDVANPDLQHPSKEMPLPEEYTTEYNQEIRNQLQSRYADRYFLIVPDELSYNIAI